MPPGHGFSVGLPSDVSHVGRIAFVQHEACISSPFPYFDLPTALHSYPHDAPMNDAWYLKHLACPDCSSALRPSEHFACHLCDYRPPTVDPLDLRPQNPRAEQLSFSRTTSVPALLETMNLSRPPIAYHGPKAERDSTELISAAMPFLSASSKLLDLGCGPRDQSIVAQHCGYQYVGVDYSNPAADLLADAHALPFANATFDGVISYAVFEHLRNPFLAIHEVKRVLRPGGVFFGTVSQGEPFHLIPISTIRHGAYCRSSKPQDFTLGGCGIPMIQFVLSQ